MKRNEYTVPNTALTLMYSNEPVFKVRLASQENNTMQNLTFIVVDDTMIMTNTTFQVEVRINS